VSLNPSQKKEQKKRSMTIEIEDEVEPFAFAEVEEINESTEESNSQEALIPIVQFKKLETLLLLKTLMKLKMKEKRKFKRLITSIN